MKRKLLALLLTVGMLAGCEAVPGVTDMDAATLEPAMVEQMITPDIYYQVELETYEDAAMAEDGTVLATYRAQVPVMRAYLEDGSQLEEAQTEAGTRALETVEAFNQQFASWLTEDHLDNLAEDAQQAYDMLKEEGLTMVGNYTEELSCSVYQTPSLVSVSGLFYTFTGGAHPNTAQLGWNFDLENGQFFTGGDLTGGNAPFRDEVTEELIRQADLVAQENGMKPEELFWPEYQSSLADWNSYTVYFDESGMTVAFAPYELAPYSAGSQEFKISYEWLKERLPKHGRDILGIDDAETAGE